MRFPVLAIWCLLASVCFGQGDRSIVPGHRFEKPPSIDGIVDPDGEWAGAPSFSGLFDEDTGQPDPDEMRWWVGYDERFIYFAARVTLKDPKGIKATEYRTNVSLNGDDFVGLMIDPFGTLHDKNQFEINPRGGTNLSIAGGRAAKREWLGEFVAKARMTESGYEVEAKIPWGLMRLPGAGKRNLRLMAFRTSSQTQRTYESNLTSNGQVNNVATWTGVQVPDGGPRSLKLLPYGYGGLDDKRGIIANSGLDLKTGLTDEIDLVGSINPDFRNIENQILALDFSYFERLAGESRPFFLEGQNYFVNSRDAPLFAPQRIRDFDFGFKTYGKLTDRTSVALLDTVDVGKRNSFAGEVIQTLGPRTTATVSATNLATGSIANTGTYAGISHGFGELSIFAQHMTTHDRQLGNGHRYNTGLDFERNGFHFGGEYVEISPEFLPRLGFAPERDFKGFNTTLEYTRPLASGRLMEYGVEAHTWNYHRFAGDPYRSGASLATSTTLRDGTNLDIEAETERFLDHDDRLVTVDLERPRGDPYRHWRVGYSFGRLDERDYRRWSAGVSYRPLKDLQLNGSVHLLDYGGQTDQEVLSAYYDLGSDRSISGRAVRTGGDINFYLAFRRSGNLGAEYFLILGDPNARTFRPSIVLKVVFPLSAKI